MPSLDLYLLWVVAADKVLRATVASLGAVLVAVREVVGATV